MKDFTFGQAKRMLANAPYLHGTTDVGEQINNAVFALAGLSGWEFLRRLVRLFSATPVFSLPQGVAGLTRLCVNGSPASLHGTDYQFLHSGPGDLDNFLKQGFSVLPPSDVADLGYSPILAPLTAPVVLAATSARDDRPQAPVTVSGLSPDGVRVVKRLPVGISPAGVAPGYEAFHETEDATFLSIDAVVLDSKADDYITLWGMQPLDTSVRMLGHYHPSVQVPKFRQYRIKSGRGPYDLLAEVRVDPLPLVNDDDVVPIPSIEPIRLMMLYEHQVAMNELQSAQQYMQQAIQWLQQMQIADNTVQAPVVQNVIFEGSGGDVESSWNL